MSASKVASDRFRLFGWAASKAAAKDARLPAKGVGWSDLPAEVSTCWCSSLPRAAMMASICHCRTPASERSVTLHVTSSSDRTRSWTSVGAKHSRPLALRACHNSAILGVCNLHICRGKLQARLDLWCSQPLSYMFPQKIRCPDCMSAHHVGLGMRKHRKVRSQDSQKSH